MESRKEFSITKSNEDLYKALLNKTASFFPKDGRWVSSCFKKPTDVVKAYMPCHLNDDKWLAKLMQKELNLPDEYYKEVLDFVTASELFQNNKHEYGLEIVRWQIKWMTSGGEGWIYDEKYGGELTFLTPSCDLGFRKGVVDTLTAIGMDNDIIEEGLEKYADKWRLPLIRLAFINKYVPVMYNLIDSNKGKNIPPVDPMHEQLWIKMRLYEYYCKHKKSVDLYGSITPEMKMTPEEAEELSLYLDVWNEGRLNLIDSIIHGEDEANNKNHFIDGNKKIKESPKQVYKMASRLKDKKSKK